MFTLLTKEPRDTTELVERFYKGQENIPFSPRETGMQYLKSLMEKADYNQEPWRIVKSKRRGQIPVNWCLAPRVLNTLQRNEYIRMRLKFMQNKLKKKVA